MRETNQHTWILRDVESKNTFWQCTDCNVVYKMQRTDSGINNSIIEPPVWESDCD